MAGGFALGGLAESTRRLVGGRTRGAVNPFLTGANAERLARRLSRMRGAAMKIGQMLSLEGEDLLPPEFAQALGLLRASADTMPPTQVRRVLGREYGRGWQKRFRSIDLEPIAAASIGQVHTAVTADGRELALKIQYPGVAKSIDSDLDNLAALLRAAHVLPVDVDVRGIIRELKRELRQEADYRIEAHHLERYRELVADDADLVVPRVHADLSTVRVLAMDRMHGLPIEDLRGPEHPQRRRDSTGRKLQTLLFRELFEFHTMQTDPNFSNYLLLPDGERLGLLDFGATQEISVELAERYRALLRAVLAEDRTALRQAAIELGFTTESEKSERIERLLDLILLVCEPLRHNGVYDFAASDLAARSRSAGFELAFRHGFLRPPPPETMFLHRKLGGMFLLCARIRARIDARAAVEPFLLSAD